jgi:hypothetical protein
MKKFMFSAVAMIAFVGSSMASTIEGELELADPPTIAGCIAKAMAHLDAISAYSTMTDRQILAEFNKKFDECYGTKSTSFN